MEDVVRNRVLSALTLAIFYGVYLVGAVDDLTSDLAREWRRRRV